MRTIRLIAAEKEAAQEMSDENRTGSGMRRDSRECAAAVADSVPRKGSGAGRAHRERVLSRRNQQGDTWIWAVFRLADGSRRGRRRSTGQKRHAF